MKMTPSAVQAELERILKSRSFRSRKTAQKFLAYVVEQTLQGQGSEINQQLIATQALGKDQDFDPSSNPLIRVQAGRLRKQLEEYYSTEGQESQLRITLPMGSYQPSFLDRNEHQKRLRQGSYARIPSPSISSGPALVCVPRAFTADATTDLRLINRLTRDFVAQLTQFNFCQLIFADENDSREHVWPDAAYSEYNADFALLFDLFDEDDGFSLKSCLAHGKTRQIVWAKNFSLGKKYPAEQELHKIFRRIAHDTVGYEQGVAHSYWAQQLLDSGEDIPAHQQVMVALRGRTNRLSPETLNHARQVCEKRLNQYPQDIQANIVLADLCRSDYLARFGCFDAPVEEWRKVTDKLLGLAPSNPYTQMSAALISLLDGHHDAYLEQMEKSLALSPLDTHLTVMAGISLVGIGRWDEGIAKVRESMETSPIHPDWYNIPLALHAYMQGNYAEALNWVRKIRTMSFWALALRAILFRQNDMQAQYDEEMERLMTNHSHLFATHEALLRSSDNTTENDIINKMFAGFLPEALSGHAQPTQNAPAAATL